MFKNFPLWPERASTFAGEVDALYLFLIGVSAFFTILIVLLVIVFAVKYRRSKVQTDRPKAVHGSTILELAWSIIPFIIAMGMFAWGSSVYFKLNRPPAGSMDVYVVGKQWMWKFQHMNGVREINELHVPVGRSVRLTMASEDVIHSMYVPAFRVKGDVVPGRYRTMWFEANKPGRYHLFCAEYCGTKHAGMIGWVEVMEPAAFQTWLSGGPTTGSVIESGEKLFAQLACNTCHLPDRDGRGPLLAGLFGMQVQIKSGEIVEVDESYVRESILNPQAKLVPGFQPIMPTYQGQISEEGLLQLIAYIKSLAEKPASETAAPAQVPAPGEGK